MNKTIYFPAISFHGQLTSMCNTKHIKVNKTFDFFNNTGIFQYPFLLSSAGHCYKKMNLKNDLKIDLNKTMFLGDSGGYQLATNVIKFTDEIVDILFQWLENNTNYAVNLDFPPYVSSEHSNDMVQWFDDRLKISIKNFDYFCKNQSGKTKYLNVLHGREQKLINNWYDSVKDYNFTGGWGLGGTSINLYYVLYSFFYLFEKGEFQRYNNKNALIHILGLSKSRVLPYLSYLQLKLNKLGIDINISFDSSYPIQTAGWGHYFLFNNKSGITNLMISNKIVKDKLNINKDANLPCSCPICKNMTYGDLFSMVSETGFTQEFYLYTAIHNVYKFLEGKTIIENLIQSDCKDMYQSIFNQDEYKVFSIIDNAFDSDKPFEYIYRNKDLITKIDLDSPIESNKKLTSLFE